MDLWQKSDKIVRAMFMWTTLAPGLAILTDAAAAGAESLEMVVPAVGRAGGGRGYGRGHRGAVAGRDDPGDDLICWPECDPKGEGRGAATPRPCS